MSLKRNADTKNKLTQGEAAVAAAMHAAISMGDFSEFTTDKKLEKLHSVLLLMLKDFSALCQLHNLSWVACYGTAIGALRHKGFIPWDDDIDIYMPRQDLEKLIAIVNSAKNMRYEIVNAQIFESYPLPTTRFCLRGTEFRDSSLMHLDFPSGIFLDLFPLDILAEKKIEYYWQVYGSWFFNKLAEAKQFSDPIIAHVGIRAFFMKHGAALAHLLLNVPFIRKLNPNNVSYKILTKHRYSTSRKIGYTCDTFPTYALFNLDDIFPVRWVPFEDTSIPIAANAEKILDKQYGDWLQLPPGNARKAHYPEVLNFGTY